MDDSTSYYSLKMPLSRIHWVSTWEDLQKSVEKISQVIIVFVG